MAESDMMLSVIKIKADGIQIIDVVDTKYEKLGTTMAKGKKRTEGHAKAMKDLQTISDKNAKSTMNDNVQTIAKLQVMEAATSGLNQLISAQYKRIDADLAAGEITAEEADERRKAIKQQEKYTGILESAIAISRLYTVAQVIGAAVTAKFTTATNVNTKAVAANNAVLAMNPYVRFAMIAMTVVAALALMELKFDGVTRAIERTKKAIEKITGAFSSLKDMGNVSMGFDANKPGTGKPSFVNQSRELGFGGGRSV